MAELKRKMIEMASRKCIEVISEKDARYYGLQVVSGYDHLNLQRVDFEPGFINTLRGGLIRGTTLIKKPHRVKVGSIVIVDEEGNVKKVVG